MSPFVLLLALACVRQPSSDGEDPPPPDETEDDLLALLADGDLTDMIGPIRQAQVVVDAGPPPPDGPRMGTAGIGGGGGAGGAGGTVPRDAGRGGMGPAPMCPGGTGGFPGGPDAGAFSCGPPLGRWELDDCNMSRTELRDSSFNNHVAFRSVGVTCVPGFAQQGVAMPNPRDIVYVPDQPAFDFRNGVTVATFVNPVERNGIRSLIRKRDGQTSSFVLLANRGRFQFVVNRVGASPISVAAPARVNRWTHVAATYDGVDLRLFIDGNQAATTHAPGVILPGEGPLLIGNDADQRRFEGSMDRILFDNKPTPQEVLARETCQRRPPSFVASPAVGPPTPADTPVTFDLAVTNNNSPTCAPEQFFVNTSFVPFGLQVVPQFGSLLVASGETAHFPVSISADADTEPGEHQVGFFLFPQQQSLLEASVTFVLADSGCRVRNNRELFIRDVSVVDDPIRTGFVGPAGDPRRGAWTWKTLIEQLAPRPEDAPAMTEAMLRTFMTPQTANGFIIPERPAMGPTVLDPWPRTADGELDLTRAPLRLLAIVNRIDLRSLSRGHAGEGRFVFGVQSPFGGFPLEFTIILEYALPASSEEDVIRWANDWHALGELPFPSEQYNAALQALTERFTGRDAAPGRPNGSALNALRTNEIALSFIWQLREFTISPTSGMFQPDTVKLTPDLSFDRTQTLADFINQNEESILAQTHDVPALFAGLPFLGGSVFNQLQGWFAPGVRNNDARHAFSLNTCNGCHSSQESNVFFLQVGNRFQGQEAFLSPFLTGTTVFDPVDGRPRVLNDLARRNRDLRELVCPPGTVPPDPGPLPPPVPPMGGRRDAGAGGGTAGASGSSAPLAGPAVRTAPTPRTSVAEGIRRVH